MKSKQAKIGDELLCKKNGFLYNVKKGEYYIITDIDDNMTYINITFKYYKYNIWNWFYSPQELRKMKLEKLNINATRKSVR